MTRLCSGSQGLEKLELSPIEDHRILSPYVYLCIMKNTPQKLYFSVGFPYV